MKIKGYNVITGTTMDYNVITELPPFIVDINDPNRMVNQLEAERYHLHCIWLYDRAKRPSVDIIGKLIAEYNKLPDQYHVMFKRKQITAFIEAFSEKIKNTALKADPETWLNKLQFIHSGTGLAPTAYLNTLTGKIQSDDKDCQTNTRGINLPTYCYYFNKIDVQKKDVLKHIDIVIFFEDLITQYIESGDLENNKRSISDVELRLTWLWMDLDKPTYTFGDPKQRMLLGWYLGKHYESIINATWERIYINGAPNVTVD